MAVPVGAIYSAGNDHYVFARGSVRPLPVKVTIGESNETMVQVKDGVKPGQEVLMLEAGEGRELLDLAGIKPSPTPSNPQGPASQPAMPTPPPVADRICMRLATSITP